MKLEKIIIITPKDNQTNIRVPFTLDHDCEILEIMFKYGPAYASDEDALPFIMKMLPRYTDSEVTWEMAKQYLPVENLVTLSLAYENHYLGARHTKDSDQKIVLSEKESSLGFPTLPIKKGEWELQLNVHNTCSPELIAHVIVEAKGGFHEAIRSRTA
ncbi:hypothetical protein [Jeotgalibaca sp. A127]|uniref:hypothetical protein n=1 Tax=Jeotgalibaca sp. A127 TaxID=3457324 RepID=UPI003FD50D93